MPVGGPARAARLQFACTAGYALGLPALPRRRIAHRDTNPVPPRTGLPGYSPGRKNRSQLPYWDTPSDAPPRAGRGSEEKYRRIGVALILLATIKSPGE